VTQWFVQTGDLTDDLGPLRPSDLLSLVRSGEVTRVSLVRKDDSPWFAAGEVGGLFEAALRPTIQYFCPQCEAEITEPPVTCSRCGREIRRGITKITEHCIAQRADRPANETTNSMRRWLSRNGIYKATDD